MEARPYVGQRYDLMARGTYNAKRGSVVSDPAPFLGYWPTRPLKPPSPSSQMAYVPVKQEIANPAKVLEREDRLT